MYEADKREPDLQTLKRLANFYNVTTDYLLGHETIANKDSIEEEAYMIYMKLQKVSPVNRKAIEILLGLENNTDQCNQAK